MKTFNYQINDTGGKVKDFDIKEASKQAIDEYKAAWPDRKDEKVLTLKIEQI